MRGAFPGISASSVRLARRVVAPTELPPGVTLQAIDGGPAYYADNGFTYAAAAGWDSPEFFPIALFLEKYRNNADGDKWAELKANTMMSAQGDMDLALMESRGIFLVPGLQDWLNPNVPGSNNLGGATPRANWPGVNTYDEPTFTSQWLPLAEAMPDSLAAGRFMYQNYTWTSIAFGSVLQTVDMEDLYEETPFQTLNGTNRHLEMFGMDYYWFSAGLAVDALDQAGSMYALGRNMTSDQAMRGCRYGDIIRYMRQGDPNHGYTAWDGFIRSAFIESCAPYVTNNTAAEVIRPAMLNAAVWAQILNGARMTKYFTLNDDQAYQGGGVIGQDVWEVPLPGETVSNYQQLINTNTLILQLASVINSPFANGYVTVSPPRVVLSVSQPDSGFDVMAKYHNRGVAADSKFYVFAMPRYGFRVHNGAGTDIGAESWPKTATFTIKNTGATQVTVVNESRTISVTGGGTTFEDSFASPHVVHIYRVDD